MEQTNYKKKNRFTVVAFLGLFTLPIIIAWAAYFSGWFEDVNTTNKGEWVTPIVELEDLHPLYSDDTPVKLQPGETWKLILPAEVSQCQNDQTDSICLVNLYLIGQTHMALGKDSERLERILFNGSARYDEQQLQALKQRFTDLKVLNSRSPATAILAKDYIYIADPLGNIILRYPLVESQQAVPLKGKDILKDLKNLLKLSRLG